MSDAPLSSIFWGGIFLEKMMIYPWENDGEMMEKMMIYWLLYGDNDDLHMEFRQTCPFFCQ